MSALPIEREQPEAPLQLHPRTSTSRGQAHAVLDRVRAGGEVARKVSPGAVLWALRVLGDIGGRR